MKFLKKNTLTAALLILLVIGLLWALKSVSHYFSKSSQDNHLTNIINNRLNADNLIATHHSLPLSSESVDIIVNGTLIIKKDETILSPTISYYSLGQHNQAIIHNLNISDDKIEQIYNTPYIENIENYPTIITIPEAFESYTFNISMDYGELIIQSLDINHSAIQLAEADFHISDSVILDSYFNIENGNITYDKSYLSNVTTHLNSGTLNVDSVLHGNIHFDVTQGKMSVVSPYLNMMALNIDQRQGDTFFNDEPYTTDSYNLLLESDTQLDLSMEEGTIELYNRP